MVRISFSNLFKEFKSTSTWLQFPYRHRGAETDSSGGNGDASLSFNHNGTCWTFLALNLKETLSKYLTSSYSYLKNVKLCANILVKNVFTSDIEYSPLEFNDIRGGGYFQAPPREMSLPLPKGAEFLDVYDYVCFPYDLRRKHRHAAGRGGSVRRPGLPKLLKGVKPDAVLVSMPDGGNERQCRRTESNGSHEVMTLCARHTRRSDDHKTSKSRGCATDGEVECFVKSEMDDSGKSAGREIFVGKSSSWRLAERECVGSGSSGGGGAGSSVPLAETRSSDGEEEEGEVHVHMEQGTNVAWTRENSSRPGTIVTIEKAKIIVSLENSDCTCNM